MKKRNKKNINEEVNYWQSSTDVLAALLMIVLLIMMILLLYLVRIPDENLIDDETGNETSVAEFTTEYDPESGEETSHENSTDNDNPEQETTTDYNGNEGEGGDHGEGGEGSNIGIYDGTGPGDGLGKTALYVMVVDADTRNTIKEAGINFELHIFNDLKKEWQLSVLNTYYPVEIEYRNYETTDEGIFFLPEKIYLGKYKLHELTAPYGYDMTEDLEFPVDEGRDWNEPIIVTVPLSPSKNIIRVQMNDQVTKDPIEGGTYYVIASEDIVTKDGTVRYSKGEIVDEIVCDEKGYGESIELYLGNYELQQHEIPEYYAASDAAIDVEVVKKIRGVEPKLQSVLCQKTTFTIDALDELYANIPIDNSRFSVSYYQGTNKTDYFSTNEFGEFEMTNLAKNTTYHVKQLTTMGFYNLNAEELEIYVDEKGRISGEVTPIYKIQNRLLRLKVGVRDIILKNLVSDMNVTIFNEDGSVYTSWDSTGMTNMIEGMPVGNYYILINGREGSRKNFTVHDSADIQEVYVSVWTNKSIGALAFISLLLLLIIIVLIVYMVKHKDERKEKRAAKKEEKQRKKEERKRLKEESKNE